MSSTSSMGSSSSQISPSERRFGFRNQVTKQESPTELLFEALLSMKPSVAPESDDQVQLTDGPDSSLNKSQVDESKSSSQKDDSKDEQDEVRESIVASGLLQEQIVAPVLQVEEVKPASEEVASVEAVVGEQALQVEQAKPLPEGLVDAKVATPEPTPVATQSAAGDAIESNRIVADQAYLEEEPTVPSEIEVAEVNPAALRKKKDEDGRHGEVVQKTPHEEGSVRRRADEGNRSRETKDLPVDESHIERSGSTELASSSAEPTKTKREMELEKRRDGDRHERNDANPTSKELQESSNAEGSLNTADKPMEAILDAMTPVEVPVQDATILATLNASATAAAAAMVDSGSHLKSVETVSTAGPSNRTIEGLAGSTGAASQGSTASKNAQGPFQSSGTLSPRQEVRLVQRVMRGFEQLASGEGQVKLRLHPPQLGSLQMTLKMEGSTMSAKLEVENGLARDAILENLPKLREKLAEQGVKVEKFEVQIAPTRDTTEGQDAMGQRGGFGQSDSGNASSFADQRRQAGAWRSPWDSQQDEPATGAVPQNSSQVSRFRSNGKGIDLTA